jgi:hypothetical protein
MSNYDYPTLAELVHHLAEHHYPDGTLVPPLDLLSIDSGVTVSDNLVSTSGIDFDGILISDFEDVALGETPPGWSTSNVDTDDADTVTVQDDVVLSGTRSLEIRDDLSDLTYAYRSISDEPIRFAADFNRNVHLAADYRGVELYARDSDDNVLWSYLFRDDDSGDTFDVHYREGAEQQRENDPGQHVGEIEVGYHEIILDNPTENLALVVDGETVHETGTGFEGADELAVKVDDIRLFMDREAEGVTSGSGDWTEAAQHVNFRTNLDATRETIGNTDVVHVDAIDDSVQTLDWEFIGEGTFNDAPAFTSRSTTLDLDGFNGTNYSEIRVEFTARDDNTQNSVYLRFNEQDDSNTSYQYIDGSGTFVGSTDAIFLGGFHTANGEIGGVLNIAQTESVPGRWGVGITPRASFRVNEVGQSGTYNDNLSELNSIHVLGDLRPDFRFRAWGVRVE